MPIFEYKCEDCGIYFEELVLSDDDKPDCPVCHSTSVDKQISPFSSAFGGGGYLSGSSSCGAGGFS